MKSKHLLFIVAAFAVSLIAQQANAKVWRVNNRSNFNGTTLFGDNLGGTVNFPVFQQIQQALDWGGGSLVSAGDTLHMEPSSVIYDNATITRKLIIIGTGYFLSSNSRTGITTDSSSIGAILFDPGSEGSQLIGMSIGNTNPYYVFLNTNNLTVKRCYIRNTFNIGGSGLSDIFVVENFFASYGGNALTLSNPYINPNNLNFNNNICQRTLIWTGSFTQCNNNVFDGPINVKNLEFNTAEFKNNILKPINATVNINNGNSQNIISNIGTSATQFGTANNNLVVPVINSLFITSVSLDGAYQIAPGSQASNNGSDGTDRGPFGGASLTNRYTLSGLAPIPVIYDINTIGVSSASGLPVTIKARTIK